MLSGLQLLPSTCSRSGDSVGAFRIGRLAPVLGTGDEGLEIGDWSRIKDEGWGFGIRSAIPTETAPPRRSPPALPGSLGKLLQWRVPPELDPCE